MEQKVITLETPLQRGEQTINDITLRKPSAGELRGLSLVSLLQMEVTADYRATAHHQPCTDQR